MGDLFTDIRRLLEEEEAQFGPLFLLEPAGPGKEAVMPSRKPDTSDDLNLFDLSRPSPPLTTEAWGKAASLEELNAQICTCMKCALGATRTNFVFGVGDPHSTLMLIGEAPGADEDAQGEPFVGRAGQLLNKILEAIQFRRGEVYICNILKCRPPGNRKPQPGEVESCLPYLKKQIELVQPKVIVCLGLTAAEELLGTRESLTALRGRVLSYAGIPVMVTYHPAALLRNPNWKRPAWEDVKALRKLHDEQVAKAKA